ncbi:MAG TPA: putative molybdenum carrier protein [Pyrinomonadaceae bacterium]|nr:putative molybdenum carrier protein [Pyrinomonadaceae bacterium]
MIAVKRIVSGGQTGADRAALDFALDNGIECGGHIPLGRRAEDGPIDPKYPNLIETDSADYAVRTERNVVESDATLIVSNGELTGGSALTLAIAHRIGKPVFHVDLDALAIGSAASNVRSWLAVNGFGTLNVAGPRASSDPRIHASVGELLRRVFASERTPWTSTAPAIESHSR